MKGIEGLPLKYIAIVLVAAIVITAVYSVVTTFTQTAGDQTDKLGKTTEGAFKKASLDLCNQACGGATKATYDAATGDCTCSTTPP